MRTRDRIALAMSEHRQAINGLLGKDELTEDERAELAAKTTRAQELETELRAAIVADPDPEPNTGTEDGEGRELRALTDRAELGNIFECAIEHRVSGGAERELQEHFHLGANQIPIAMLREVRAVTPAPANVGQNQAAIIPAVFPQACAAFLGVDMPTVPVGEAVYPVLTTGATVHTPAENATAAETEGAFSADVLSPSRLQASFFYSREDRARFAGMSEALRMNLSEALSDKLDQQVINGANGLLNGTNLANNNRTTLADFAHYKGAFAYSRVDGTYASTVGDIRIVMGTAGYTHAATIYRANNSDDSALDVLTSRTAGLKVSAHVPALDSNNRQNSIVRLGMRRDMVAPIWEGITLIPDEITLAAKGQIKVTAVMLHAIKILRAAGFYKVGTQTA